MGAFFVSAQLVDGVFDDVAIEKLQKGVTIGVNGEKHKMKRCKAFQLKP